MTDRHASDSRLVCPRCGEPASDSTWCSGCGLNLRLQGDLPTAEEYAAKQREAQWLAEQDAEAKTATEAEHEQGERRRAERQRQEEQHREVQVAARVAKKQAKRAAKQRRRAEHGWRARLRWGLLATAVMVLVLVLGAGAWRLSGRDVPLVDTATPDHDAKPTSSRSAPAAVKYETFLAVDSDFTFLIEPADFGFDGGGLHGKVNRAQWQSWGTDRATARGQIDFCQSMAACHQGQARLVARNRELFQCSNGSFYLYRDVRVYGRFHGSGTELFSSPNPCRSRFGKASQ